MRPVDEATYSAETWLEFAEDDLVLARSVLGQARLGRLICYHAQQAAEKALKAYVADLTNTPVPRTHNLLALSQLIREMGGRDAPEWAVEVLNEYGTMPRYPPAALPSPEAATRAVGLAEDVLSFVRTAIPEATESSLRCDAPGEPTTTPPASVGEHSDCTSACETTP